VQPALFQNFVPPSTILVQAYFDIGNHVKYAHRSLDSCARQIDRQVPCEGLQLNPTARRKVRRYPRGSINWPTVRQALDDIGYNGWMTIEGSGGLALEEQNAAWT